jgi:lipoprotein-anchoring transpeptidase ErfK/SrfK
MMLAVALLASLLLAACGAGGLAGLQGLPAIQSLQGGAQGVVQKAVVATHKPPLAPADLRVATAGGAVLAPETWTNQTDLRLVAALGSPEAAAQLVPEAELRPAEEPFSGTPTLIGAAMAPGETTLAIPAGALEAGRRYHWQVRAREVNGRSGPWTAYEGSFGFAPAPPAAPVVAPLPNNGVVTQRQVRVEWTADGGPAGVAGFVYAVGRTADLVLPAEPVTAEAATTLNLNGDGEWFFRVRTLDNAGNWSEPVALALQVDTLPVQIADVSYRTAAIHPDYGGSVPITFTLNKAADVTVTVLPASGDTPARTYALGRQEGGVSLAWDGKDDAGASVPVGSYRFRIAAVDSAGRVAEATYTKLLVTQKRIVVNLTRQSLAAYDGDSVFITSLVTTGGPDLPTPAGTFSVMAKYSPFTFKSPWPKGSPYWYPDSPASFAMLFEDGGYFIHDAPWRGNFGPGSNLSRGTPGGDYTGTHGCVNVPYGVASRLFAWADVGTPVIVTY